MTEYDEIEEDYRNEQGAYNAQSRLPAPQGDMVARYWRGLDCPDSMTADVVYIDRLLGIEVLRYDGADPANTRFDYGAIPDAECFARKGLNIKEMIASSQCTISLQQCAMHMRKDWGADDYYD